MASQGEGVVPSIVVGDGLVFSASGFEKPTVRAVRPGGRGDVTKTHLAWEATDGVPAIPSFLYLKPHLYVVTETGVLACREASSGKVLWRERLEGSYSASPVAADGRVYFLNEEGLTTVIAAGPKFEVQAKNPLGETCQASMAVSGGALFIRTAKTLWCIRVNS